MKNVIKAIASLLIVFSINITSGCADFPDYYAVDANVGEIRMNDEAVLSDDGMSYTTTIMVDFEIRDNSFGSLSSAQVIIDDEEYDVSNQIDPKHGGTAKIPCTLDVNKDINVMATMKISTHSFDRIETIQPRSFADEVQMTTGIAEGVTPCSADLYVNADYPWLVDIKDIYMLVSPEIINVSVNSKVDNFKGQVLRCFISYDTDYYNSKIYCTVKGLDSNTPYYYKMVQLNSDSRIVNSGDTRTFTTAKTTATIKTSVSNIGFTTAKVNATFNQGNLKGLYASDWNVVWHIGKTLEELDESPGTKFYASKISSPYTFSGLDASSTYYYRCDLYIGDGFMCSSDVGKFTTLESTASVTITQKEIFDTNAKISVSLDKGNTTGIIASSASSPYYASIKILYGVSPNSLFRESTISAYSSDSFDFWIYDLLEDKKYYYRVCYYSGKSLLAFSDVLEFNTYKSSDIINLGFIDIDTWNTSSSGSKQYSINARKGSVVAFSYSLNQGGNSLRASLTGAGEDVSLLNASSSYSDWKSGSIYYVFSKEGTYILTLKYSVLKCGSLSIPMIKFMY